VIGQITRKNPEERLVIKALPQGEAMQLAAPTDRRLDQIRQGERAPRPQELLHLPALRRAQRVRPEEVRRSPYTPAHSRPPKQYADGVPARFPRSLRSSLLLGEASLDGTGPTPNRPAAERLRSRAAAVALDRGQRNGVT